MKPKKLPYGLSDFKRVMQEDFYYIDKTKFLQTIEDEASFLYFLRPRRFGKSLTIAMLEAYYDVFYKDQYESIFKTTYIYKNPTPLKSSFYIMRFNFSAVDTTDYESSFRNHISLKIDNFCKKYDIEILSNINPIDKLETIFDYCSQQNLPMYILIDEYDNFVTKLLVSDMDAYKNIVTSKSAIYKEFFTMLKVGTEGAVKKMFFTGVSPLALYDVTSGSNIGKNISLDKSYNDMVGVTKDELNQMIKDYDLDDKKDSIISRCDEYYNSYRFHKDINHTIYNSDMILYYFDSLIRKDCEPDDLIDVNVRTDYTKLKYLVYTNKKLNGNFEMLNNLILGNNVTTTKIKDNFSAFELTNEDNFKSFMFSLGFMTIEKKLFQLNLKTPNQTIKKLLSEFIHYAYKEFDDYKMSTEKLDEKLAQLAISKDLSVFHYIAKVIKESSSIRDFIDGENFIKAFILSYLNLNNFYQLKIKSEVEQNKGYIDILLEPVKGEVPYGAIIELKYIKRGEYSQKLLEDKIKEAKKQLNQYNLGDKFIKIVVVFKGWEMVGCQEV
ncbi:MAG: AAA family ATPase, partial [Campylobacterota bacterium]|nr:AAA family ATPase [Campylobacterota bacterium]